MTYLVDSDWVADYLKGRPRAVELLGSLVVDGLAISIVTYAEVLEGIYYGHDPARHEEVLRRFLHGSRILGVTKPVAQCYARISGDLRSKGLLLPPSDLFIAATALQHILILVTRNCRHFDRIPDLQLHNSPIS
jgi:tRNA(fMet)-specific endonuclease VapC